MANDNLGRLGGGVANAVALRSTPTVDTGADKNVSTLVSGINDIVQSVAKVSIVNAIQKNEEDKVRAVSQAETEHLDTNNAMQGGSYDSTLNSEVDNWRSSGLTDSEVRLKIKEYKMNKSVKDLGLDTGNRQADKADIAYFDTYNKLELKAITPLLTEDRKNIQDKIINMTSSYIRNGSDSLQDKYNNTVTTNKSYGMGENEATMNLMNSAFDLARKGDDSLLKELHTVKNSQGDLLIDTASGSSMYSKLSDNLLQKKEHDQAQARKEADFQQEVQATKLYTTMVETKDLNSFKLGIDTALETGKISMQQHNSLNTYYKTATNVDAFPKQSDRSTYVKAYSLAEQGLLKTDDLMIVQSKLSNSDFELIARTAIQKGGIYGVGNDETRGLQERIKDDATSFGGSSGINDITTELHSKQIFPMRTGYIQQNLKSSIDSFIATNKRVPNEDEYTKLRTTIVSNAEKLYNEKTIKPITIVAPPVTKADNTNGRQELISTAKAFKTSQERDAWYNSLSPAEQKLLKGI